MLSKDYQDRSARNKGPGTGETRQLLPHDLSRLSVKGKVRLDVSSGSHDPTREEKKKTGKMISEDNSVTRSKAKFCDWILMSEDYVAFAQIS